MAKRSARKKTKTRSARQPAAGARKSARKVERRRRNPESLRLRGFVPSFTVNDLDRSIRFYTDVLGFIVGQKWQSDDGAMRGVMLKAGACELGLSQDDFKKGRDRRKGEGVRISCKTAQDVDALAARIKAAGHQLTEEPTTYPWGDRMFGLDDPDGFHLTIYSGPA